MLYIQAPHFCCGVVLEGNTVFKVAPIVKYMFGWPVDRAEAYCKSKGWKCTRLP